MPKHKYAVLLAGGQGSRFWPQSRTLEPKQFLSFFKDSSLFGQTVSRIKHLIPAKNIFVVTSELYRHQILEFTAPFKIPPANIIFEPEPKNTAPSIGLAARLISILDPEAMICVFPCDHRIKNKVRLHRLLNKAIAVCQDNIVIFGIPPSRPATGYGYIKAQKRKISAKAQKRGVLKVEKFLEKPDPGTARKLVKSGGYFWNSGIFIGSCRVFLEEIKKRLPGFSRQLLKIKGPADIKSIWGKVRPVSFDYGVLEKSKSILMLKADGLGWSDLGSWQAWDEELKKDKSGNALKADVISIGSKNTTVLGYNRLIAAIGLEDIIVVDTPDALLITRKGKSEQVKKVVDILKEKRRQEYYTHKAVKRPWGGYTVLDTGCGFKVKLVEIKPGHSLSLQFHKKRSEHWVVVEGKAVVIKGRKRYTLSANESTYIPCGCAHRLMNPCAQPLKIIEVQAGGYLEEDDIVRIKDDFGRL